MARVVGTGPAVISVLDLDPALGSGIGSEDWETARRLCRAELVRVPSGRRVFPETEGGDAIGFVIVAGLVCRELALRDRRMLELLGDGEVVYPPTDSDEPRLGTGIVLTAVVDTALVALGGSFIAAAARWPSLLRNVHERLESQRNNLAVLGLIAHLPRAEHRVLLVLHHLADRWGFVTPEGIVLRLPLSHDLLGQLAAARRSTITLALSALDRDGQVRRLDDGSWLLTGSVEKSVRSISKTSASARPLGELLAARARASEQLQDARALQAEARLARRRLRP